jgi:hypothetical protein
MLQPTRTATSNMTNCGIVMLFIVYARLDRRLPESNLRLKPEATGVTVARPADSFPVAVRGAPRRDAGKWRAATDCRSFISRGCSHQLYERCASPELCDDGAGVGFDGSIPRAACSRSVPHT